MVIDYLNCYSHLIIVRCSHIILTRYHICFLIGYCQRHPHQKTLPCLGLYRYWTLVRTYHWSRHRVHDQSQLPPRKRSR